jgi:hypothetical protein
MENSLLKMFKIQDYIFLLNSVCILCHPLYYLKALWQLNFYLRLSSSIVLHFNLEIKGFQASSELNVTL